MRRLSLASLVACILLLAAPETALAATGVVPRVLDLTVGGGALLLAAVMLADVLALRRVASGAAIAEHVTYVVLAVACLAASVISEWAVRFLPWRDANSIASLGSDLLVIAAMAFFLAYFVRVRRAMVRFLIRSSAELVSEVTPAEEDPCAEDAAPRLERAKDG